MLLNQPILGYSVNEAVAVSGQVNFKVTEVTEVTDVTDVTKVTDVTAGQTSGSECCW